MKEKTLTELLRSAVDFEHDTDHELIRRLNANYKLFEDIPESRMSPEIVDSVLKMGVLEFSSRVPKHLWTRYFIQLTVMRPEMRHLMDPSLVTEPMIEEMCVFGYECLKYLPHDKHPYHYAFKAVKENIEWINYINPEFIPLIVKHVSELEMAKLGGFARIKDALSLSLQDVVLSYKQAEVIEKMQKDDKTRGYFRVYKYRLESLEKQELIDLCVKLNAPEALRHIHGSQVAARAFPKASKRMWISEDLGL